MHTVHTVLLQWLRPEKHCHLQETLVCLRLCVCVCVSVEETKKNLGESGEETDKQTEKQKEIDSERNLVKFHPAAWLENLENTHHRAVACGSWAAQSPKCSNTHTYSTHAEIERLSRRAASTACQGMSGRRENRLGKTLQQVNTKTSQLL